MNRFVKKNITLVGVLSVSGLLILILLGYVVITSLDLNHYLGRTAKARDTIKKLVKQQPAPGKENEKRIQRDIDLYQKITMDLQGRFQSPMQPAVDAFIKKLPPPALTGEEAETYKVPGTGEKDDDGKIIKPLVIKKLSAAEFKTLLKSRFDQYTADMSDENKKGIDVQTTFIEDFRRIFSSSKDGDASWNSAVQAFVNTAKNLTLEPIDRANRIPLLLNALGFPRRVNTDQTVFMEHMNRFASALVAAGGATEVSMQATDFLISANSSSIQFGANEFPQILYQWDIFGDIVKRLSAAKIKQIHKLHIRKYASEGEHGTALGTLYERIGNYKFYHYTVEVVGSMESFRQAVKEFDEAFKDKRTYIIRAVYLYDDSDAAGTMMRSQTSSASQNTESSPDMPDEPQMTRRRRRSRRQNVETVRNEETSAEKNKKNEQARLKAIEEKLPINERSGYGAVLIGGKEDFRAFIDFDYVVLEQEQ